MAGLVFLYVTRKATLPLHASFTGEGEKSVLSPTVGRSDLFSLTFLSSLSATGNIIVASESVITRLPASKRRRIRVDAAFISLYPPVAQWWNYRFSAWETGVRIPV